MPKLEIKRKSELSRQEVADRLIALAKPSPVDRKWSWGRVGTRSKSVFRNRFGGNSRSKSTATKSR